MNLLLAVEHQWQLVFRLLRGGWPGRRIQTFEIVRERVPKAELKVKTTWEPGWPADPKLWPALTRAETSAQVKAVCRRWEKWLLRGPGLGLRCYPQRLAVHASKFLAIKKDARYPRSFRPTSDTRRLEALARGMAGVDTGISPATAIDRLRKMKHLARCRCWRCSQKRREEDQRFIEQFDFKKRGVS